MERKGLTGQVPPGSRGMGPVSGANCSRIHPPFLSRQGSTWTESLTGSWCSVQAQGPANTSRFRRWPCLADALGGFRSVACLGTGCHRPHGLIPFPARSICSWRRERPNWALMHSRLGYGQDVGDLPGGGSLRIRSPNPKRSWVLTMCRRGGGGGARYRLCFHFSVFVSERPPV